MTESERALQRAPGTAGVRSWRWSPDADEGHTKAVVAGRREDVGVKDSKLPVINTSQRRNVWQADIANNTGLHM